MTETTETGKRGGARAGAGRPPTSKFGRKVEMTAWLPLPLIQWLDIEAREAGLSRSEFLTRKIAAMKQRKGN